MRQVPRPLALLGAVLAFLAPAASPGFCWDWPLSPPRVAATFGTFAKGRAITGLALASDETPVRAADDGELSFEAEEGISPSGLPMSLGSFVVLEHPKGMAAVYSHLERGSASATRRLPHSGDAVGVAGSSGWIEGSGLVFQVFDRKAGTWVNPLLVLPPLVDDKPPVIRSLALSRADKLFVIGSSASVPQGTYLVSAEVSDSTAAIWPTAPLAPFGISLSIDGAELVKDSFDTARCEKGRLLFFGKPGVDAEGLRTKEGRYALAERLFTRGRTSIEVGVEDVQGNRRSSTWTFTVE